MDLYYLIYTSTPSKLLDDDSLNYLLTQSREANTRFGVTGMLIFLPDSFIQLIEGPRQHIEQLYENIQQDKRNLRIITLREGYIKERFFPDWAMAFEKKELPDLHHGQLGLDDDKVMQLFTIMEA